MYKKNLQFNLQFINESTLNIIHNLNYQFNYLEEFFFNRMHLPFTLKPVYKNKDAFEYFKKDASKEDIEEVINDNSWESVYFIYKNNKIVGYIECEIGKANDYTYDLNFKLPKEIKDQDVILSLIGHRHNLINHNIDNKEEFNFLKSFIENYKEYSKLCKDRSAKKVKGIVFGNEYINEGTLKKLAKQFNQKIQKNLNGVFLVIPVRN